jgi:heme exporter protein A
MGPWQFMLRRGYTPRRAGGKEARVRLWVEAASCFRGDRLVLDRLTFGVPAGGALLLLGPNGAGKSTLLRVLAGLKHLDAGRVTFDGSDELAGKIAYLGHQDAIKPGLTALENLAFAGRIGGGDPHAALATAGLETLATLPARMLSAGQKRRLALARLTLLRAPLWLLDEPTLGLDTASVEKFGATLALHRQAGGIVVAATHLPLPIDAPETLELRHGMSGGVPLTATAIP